MVSELPDGTVGNGGGDDLLGKRHAVSDDGDPGEVRLAIVCVRNPEGSPTILFMSKE